MKKTLAVLMALTMLFALCVPAFAADTTITEATQPTEGTALIQTDISDYVDTDGYYSLSFPATTTIPWNTASTTLDCTVYANLLNSKKLQVSVTAPAGSKMTDNANHEIAFALGTATFTTADSFANNVAWAPTVDIETAAWNAVPLSGEYAANLTFTAEVVA